MGLADVISALFLALPPWLGFWIFRRKGRVGLSYGYFLGGILAVLALPWSELTGRMIPSTQLGGALFGFTLFLQAQREGGQGLRRLGVGVGGASLFELLLLVQVGLPWRAIPQFWAGAILEAVLWLLLSDLAYRWARGRLLELRMPLIGALALGLGAIAQALLPASIPRVPWPAALLGGVLLGLVAAQQLHWLRNQGAWVEGRGHLLRTALALLDQGEAPESAGLTLGLDPRQPQWLVDEKGRVLESNGPFSRLVGLPRHRLRGYGLDALFQGGEKSVWATLKEQLLKHGCGSAAATQVSEDGAFREVRLETTAFDRGMALVWIADPTTGTLAIRGEGGSLLDAGGEEVHRRTTNALTTLLTSAGFFNQVEAGGPLARAALRLHQATTRLGPGAAPGASVDPLPAPSAMEAMAPLLRKMIPESAALSFRTSAIHLLVRPETLQQICTHILLHAREQRPQGPFLLALDRVVLGGRPWGLLQTEVPSLGDLGSKGMLGLGWLRQAVTEARGLLELEQDDLKGLHPRIYLPVEGPPAVLSDRPFADRRIWVVDRDPLLRDTLVELVQLWGGQAASFGDLQGLLRKSRGETPPDLLVLERTPTLERFQKALRTFQREPIPTLVLGLGHPLPLSPVGLGIKRLGYLDKPFAGPEFAQSLLALLHSHSR